MQGGTTTRWAIAFCGVLAGLWLAVAAGSAAAQVGLVPKVGAATAQADEPVPVTPLDSLLEVLKDDAARAALIGELERQATPVQPDVATEPAAEVEPISLGRRIALVTQSGAERLVGETVSLWASIKDGGGVFAGLSGGEIGILIGALPGLLVVIAITVTIFVSLRWLALGMYTRLGKRAESAGFLRSATLFAASNLTDVLIVVLAWAAGYLVTLLMLGDFGQVGIRQTLYLNAFLLVELVKVAIRSVLSPIASGLRVVPVSDHAAQAITRSLSIVVSVLGYGQLLVVPIVNKSASSAAGNGVSALLSVFVLLYLVYVVLRRRAEVATWLSHKATAQETDPQASRGWIMRSLTGLAQLWHVFVLIYLGVMFVLVMTQPAERTYGALLGSGKILAAVVLAALVSGWLTRAVGRGISLPHDINAKLPLLERRINRFVPRAFGMVRLGLLVAVFLFTLDIIGFIDLRGWLESQVGLQVSATLVALAAILLVSFVLWLALTSFVDYKLNPEYGAVPTARETTLLTLLRNAATIALVVLTLMFSLSEIGLDIGPLLASAGVLGLAIGFGSQKLVQDIITGVFIQFENAINVGDVITVGGTTGSVEKLSVRSVSLRDAHGVFHIIPFSTVDMVSNFMKEFSYSVCDMGIAYREKVEDAKLAMHDAFDLLMQDPEIAPDILGELEWFGVTTFADSAVIVRARIKTVPGRQWAIGRAYNGHLKEVFDARGIEIPFPQQTIWFGEAKDGSTQPIRLAAQPGEPAE